jgi:hypothetical protein
VSAIGVPRGTYKRKRTPESYVLEAILEYLAVKHIFALRMNSGSIRMEGQNGRTRYFKGHEPGTADVLALPVAEQGLHWPTWIEAKADNGKQSDLQKEFQQRVEAEGHRYILARGIDDLELAGL